MAKDTGRALLQLRLPGRDLVRVHVEQLGNSASVFSPFMAAKATFALRPELCLRRLCFVIVSPDPRQLRRCQARNSLIGLSGFPEPPLAPIMPIVSDLGCQHQCPTRCP